MLRRVISGRSPILGRLARSVARLAASVVDLCLPRLCAACGEVWLGHDQGYWCSHCLSALPWIHSPLCTTCGRPFQKSAPTADHLCGDCLLSSPPFDAARSATLYSGVVRDGIHQLKFGGRLQWVPPLVELLVKTAKQEPRLHAEALVPVPLHVRRIRQRGFNQSGLLAGELGRRIGLPVCYDALVRKCWTEPQTRLKRKERLENVRGAFNVVRPSAVEGLDVLLIDDVFTTGSTINECARVLRKAGAGSVHCLTVARALPEWKPADADLP